MATAPRSAPRMAACDCSRTAACAGATARRGRLRRWRSPPTASGWRWGAGTSQSTCSVLIRQRRYGASPPTGWSPALQLPRVATGSPAAATAGCYGCSRATPPHLPGATISEASSRQSRFPEQGLRRATGAGRCGCSLSTRQRRSGATRQVTPSVRWRSLERAWRSPPAATKCCCSPGAEWCGATCSMTVSRLWR